MTVAYAIRPLISPDPPLIPLTGQPLSLLAPCTDPPLALDWGLDEPDDAEFDHERTSRSDLPAPGPRATVLVRALLEAFAGDRPAGQLMRWTTPELFARVERCVRPQANERPWAGTLRRVIVCEPVPGVAEVAAIVDSGGRTSAFALRLEGVDGRWLMTELEIV